MADHQRAFLIVVQELSPEVLKALHASVFNSFNEIFDVVRFQPEEGFLRLGQGQAVDPRCHFYGISENKGFVDTFATIVWHYPRELLSPAALGLPRYASEFGASQDPSRIAVRGALEAWASKFHLEADWVFDEAVATMIKWLQQGEGVDLRWALYSLEPDYTFTELGSVPKLQIEEQWAFEPLSLMRGRILSQVKAYEAELKRHAAEIGYGFPKQEPKKQQQYQWLALARCKQYNTTQIRDWHRRHYKMRVEQIPTDSAIRHAIRNSADELGLKPWIRDRGRPLKPKS